MFGYTGSPFQALNPGLPWVENLKGIQFRSLKQGGSNLFDPTRHRCLRGPGPCDQLPEDNICSGDCKFVGRWGGDLARHLGGGAYRLGGRLVGYRVRAGFDGCLLGGGYRQRPNATLLGHFGGAGLGDAPAARGARAEFGSGYHVAHPLLGSVAVDVSAAMCLVEEAPYGACAGPALVRWRSSLARLVPVGRATQPEWAVRPLRVLSTQPRGDSRLLATLVPRVLSTQKTLGVPFQHITLGEPGWWIEKGVCKKRFLRADARTGCSDLHTIKGRSE